MPIVIENPNARSQIVWPVAGMALGVCLGALPLKTGITFQAGIACWSLAMGLVLVLSASGVGARAGALLAGIFLAVPCYVQAPPLPRFLLACAMAAPFLAAGALVLVPPIAGFRARVGYLLSWGGTFAVEQRTRSIDVPALRNLIGATAILAAAIAGVKAASTLGLGQPLRWISGGVGVFAFAEMTSAGLALATAALGLVVPPLMLSPHRSVSLVEFWTKRWNPFASQKLFRPLFFAPLAHRGVGLALFLTFAVSAVGHALIAYLVLGRWGMSLMCGAFFMVQPVFIAAERRLRVRRWRPAAGWTWVLAVLALTSPLIVEPALQMAERSWGAPESVFLPTAAVLAYVVVMSSIVSLASLVARPAGASGCKLLVASYRLENARTCRRNDVGH